MTARLALPPASAPVLVGYSGGLDSTVLLHALAADAGVRGRGLRALHVDHGLHGDSALWAGHCRQACAALGVDLQVVGVSVRPGPQGPEAAARAARHGAFAQALAPGEWLALAQHRDDQAETVLLRLLRASGGDGLAGMRARRPFARGWLWRPLLGFARADLLAYARAHDLPWLEDPSNQDTRFDRNFLRHRVLPLLRERWPEAPASLARSASLLAEETELLAGETARRLAQVQLADPASLLVPALERQARPWRARVLRAWVAGLGLPPLPSRGVACIESGLLGARPDTSALFAWPGARVRRWRDLLHAGPELAALPPGWSCAWDGQAALTLPTGDRLSLPGSSPGGLPGGVVLRPRQGGERIRLPGRSHRHALKHVLQDLGVPPWERARMPLLFAADGELLAAGDLVASARLHDSGCRVRIERCL